jgi:MscS family membrane protein
VGAALTTLGIGGLAFALAAQDTIANVFGSVVVATDQPFKVGETVQIGANIGVVEDIGLRSTRIRTTAKSLLVIPNKTVAGETITNLSRFTGRRVEFTVGLTYATTADQMEAIVGDIRKLLQGDAEIDPASIAVYFRDLNASSLDIWILYNTKDGDLHRYLAQRQRTNLARMRLVVARGLSMAYPTQTLFFDGEIAKQMAGAKAPRA